MGGISGRAGEDGSAAGSGGAAGGSPAGGAAGGSPAGGAAGGPGNGGNGGAGGTAAAGAGGATSAGTRPNLLFIFDNSGSMDENASGTWVGENTNICPSPSAVTSRMYSAKAALRGALSDLGTQANVGLMSFPIQTRTPPPYTVASWCRTANADIGPVGHYAPTPSMMAGRSAGCDMSTHTGETTFGSWFTSGVGEVIRTGVTTALPGSTPTAASYDPPDANLPAVMRWIDNVELPADAGAVTDPELHGMTGTPLGRTLFYARLYFDNFVKPADPRGTCRQNMIVLLTDGIEFCDTTAPDSTFDMATCTGGGTFSDFHPIYQACRLRVGSGIMTYVIADSGLTAPELANNDRIARAGGTVAAVRVSLADSSPAKATIQGAIAAAMVPTVCPSP